MKVCVEHQMKSRVHHLQSGRHAGRADATRPLKLDPCTVGNARTTAPGIDNIIFEV